MINRRRTTVLLFVLTGLAGCGDSGTPAGPTAPSATASGPGNPVPAPSIDGETIRGTVSDSAFRPLRSARVEILDGPQAGRSATTDARGEFSLVATVDDATRFRASQAGHVTAEATILPDCERCNPRRWVHLVLDVLEPPVALAGDYTLTFVADRACTTLPDELRTRSYDATIALGRHPWANSPALADNAFRVTPTGPAFPDGLNHFWLHVAGNYVAVALGDHTDPGITERVEGDTYFAFGGWTTLAVDPAASTISAPFTGWIDACVNPAMGERYDCTPGPTVTRTRCESPRHELILTRR